jgi:hypothetical protein
MVPVGAIVFGVFGFFQLIILSGGCYYFFKQLRSRPKEANGEEIFQYFLSTLGLIAFILVLTSEVYFDIIVAISPLLNPNLLQILANSAWVIQEIFPLVMLTSLRHMEPAIFSRSTKSHQIYLIYLLGYVISIVMIIFGVYHLLGKNISLLLINF